jgi:hypothetical protein
VLARPFGKGGAKRRKRKMKLNEINSGRQRKGRQERDKNNATANEGWS